MGYREIEREKITVFKNASFLLLIQFTNYVLPLVVLPFLSRVLGPDKFGLIYFAQVLMNYFIILSDYGFNLIGVRQVSRNRSNLVELERITSSIFNLKIILGLVGFIILLLGVWLVPRLHQDGVLFILFYGIVIGNILLPTWFFQGVEEMKYLAVLNFISKLVFTLSIFLFIRSSDDYLLVPILYSIGFILSGILGILLIKKRYSLALKLVPLKVLKNQLHEGFHVFLSNFSISAYTTTNTFILGNIVNDKMLGFYGGAERIIQPIKFVLTPFYTAVFPYFSKLAISNKEKALKEIRVGLAASILVGAVLFCVLFALSDHIIVLFLGAEFLPSKNVFKVFSFLILITPISYFLFNVVFLSFSLEKYSMRIYIIGGILNLLMLAVLLVFMDSAIIAAALSNVLTQLINLLAALYIYKQFVHKKKIAQ